MKRNKYSQAIIERIDNMKDGTIFVTTDFADIATVPAINMSLSRLEKDKQIRRIIRGVYEKPRHSELLKEMVATDPSKVAYAIARKNRWTIAPTGDTALNLSRLSSQVPAVWQYVSDGPYKEYTFGNIIISFKHTAIKEASGYSYITSLIIQALRALGREHVGKRDIEILKRNLTSDNKVLIMREAQGTTAWIYEYIKQIAGGEST